MNFTRGSLVIKDWFLMRMDLFVFVFSLGSVSTKITENSPFIFLLFSKNFKKHLEEIK